MHFPIARDRDKASASFLLETKLLLHISFILRNVTEILRRCSPVATLLSAEGYSIRSQFAAVSGGQ
jgi:hypothetical protein